MAYKKISIGILGSTGSIGRTSLSILEKYRKNFSIDLLSCQKNIHIIDKQIKNFSPKFVIINDIKSFNLLRKKKYKKKVIFFNTLEAFNKFKKKKFDTVILGISSINGLEYAFSFINHTKKLLVANKETLVCGGNFFLNQAKKKNCTISSIDSEHYCLSHLLNKYKCEEIEKIYLTASGGPFLNNSTKEISRVESTLALKHPKWKMGKKISIDSATMANKGLEVMEASILFNIHPNKIKIKIHPDSKVHAIIVLKNGLVILVAHNTSMSIPIKNSLLESINKKNLKFFYNNNFFNKKKLFTFSFDEINLKKFKMLNLAYKAMSYGDRGCIFYNVVNDCLVDDYLNKKIFFYEIYNKLNKIINNKKLVSYYKEKIKNYNDIKNTIIFAKQYKASI